MTSVVQIKTPQGKSIGSLTTAPGAGNIGFRITAKTIQGVPKGYYESFCDRTFLVNGHLFSIGNTVAALLYQ
jgi:hypothetical protein